MKLLRLTSCARDFVTTVGKLYVYIVITVISRRPGHRGGDNAKNAPYRNRNEDVDWIQLSQDNVQRRALMTS
jgi:hypothetical protein